MDLNSVTDTLAISELLCDAAVEQPVEGEFNIPDYQPEIFKIIKTKADPVIVQKIASGSRATVDGYVRLTILYQSEEDRRVCSILQKLPFSRQIELSAPVGDASEIYCRAAMGFLNCRAVNSRKIDARGTVNLEVRAVSQYDYDAIGRIEEEGAHQLQSETAFVRQAACEEKQFTLEELLAVDFEGCEAPALLRCEAGAVAESVSVENGRAIVAGNVNLQLAFDISNDEEYRIKRVGFNLPFNQVLDLSLDGEEYEATAAVSVLSSGAAPAEGGNADANVTCAIELRLWQTRTASILTDAFSTKLELALSRRSVCCRTKTAPVNEPFGARFSFEKPDAALIDYFILNSDCAVQPGGIAGRATLCCLVCDAAGEISAIEHEFDYLVPHTGDGGGYSELSTLFTLLECAESGGMVNVKCEGILYGRQSELGRLDTVREIEADAAATRTRPDAALVVYYADEGESVWEIAKRFNTSPDEIAQNNDLDPENAQGTRTLLIPIVG